MKRRPALIALLLLSLLLAACQTERPGPAQPTQSPTPSQAAAARPAETLAPEESEAQASPYPLPAVTLPPLGTTYPEPETTLPPIGTTYPQPERTLPPLGTTYPEPEEEQLASPTTPTPGVTPAATEEEAPASPAPTLAGAAATETPPAAVPATPTRTATASPGAPLASPSPQATRLPTATPYLQPTLLPTVNPLSIAASLSASLSVEPGYSPSRHPLVRITGWEPGFRSAGYCPDGPYTWLDGDHLLTYPIVAVEEDMGEVEWTYPLVAGLERGRTWLPDVRPPTGEPRFSSAPGPQPFGYCLGLPVWSPALQRLVTAAEGQVRLQRAGGELTRTLPGEGPLLLSPSGFRLLAGETWYDLAVGGQRVPLPGLEYDTLAIPAWSAGERELFVWGFQYASANRREAHTFDLDGINRLGSGVGPEAWFDTAKWVLDDRYVVAAELVEGGAVPLIDPQAGTTRDLRRLAGLGEGFCQLLDVAPGRDAVWVRCEAASHLVFLNDFARLDFANPDLFPSGWSPDGDWLLLRDPDSSGGYSLLSLETGDLSSLPGQGSFAAPAWAPQEPRLAYLSGDSRSLVLLDLETGATVTHDLPQPFAQLYWRPDGEGLALLAEDGSLWWLADPARPELEPQLEPLTPALPGVHSVRWAPDGERLAFVSGPDLYAVSIRLPEDLPPDRFPPADLPAVATPHTPYRKPGP